MRSTKELYKNELFLLLLHSSSKPQESFVISVGNFRYEFAIYWNVMGIERRKIKKNVKLDLCKKEKFLEVMNKIYASYFLSQLHAQVSRDKTQNNRKEKFMAKCSLYWQMWWNGTQVAKSPFAQKVQFQKYAHKRRQPL